MKPISVSVFDGRTRNWHDATWDMPTDAPDSVGFEIHGTNLLNDTGILVRLFDAFRSDSVLLWGDPRGKRFRRVEEMLGQKSLSRSEIYMIFEYSDDLIARLHRVILECHNFDEWTMVSFSQINYSDVRSVSSAGEIMCQLMKKANTADTIATLNFDNGALYLFESRSNRTSSFVRFVRSELSTGLASPA